MFDKQYQLGYLRAQADQIRGRILRAQSEKRFCDASRLQVDLFHTESRITQLQSGIREDAFRESLAKPPKLFLK